MYNFLMAVGILLIILGLYYDGTILKEILELIHKRNKNESLDTEVNNQESKKIDIYVDDKYIQEAEDKIDIYVDDKYIEEAEDKIDIIVDEPIYDDIEQEKISFEEVLESIEVKVDNIEQNEEIITHNDDKSFDIIGKYESGEYSLEEVCNILNMKKGEVLLLRNIYKKSQG